MEESWSDVNFKQSVNNIIHDTMIAAHVINCNVRTTGLGFQAFEMTGHEYKKMIDAKMIENSSLKDLCNYTGWDSRYTLMSYYRQIEIMKEGRLAEFYAMLHRGALVLVNLYKRGVYIDLSVLNEMKQDAELKKKQAVEEMRSLPGVQRLEQKSSCEFNPESSPQLGKVIYDEYKIEVYRKTRGKKQGSTDEKALDIISRKCTNPDIQKLISALLVFRKFTGLLERIENYRNLVDSNSYVHPVYNLNIADSFRSSANDPSIQNVYKRDPELLFFRKCISVPRND